MAPRCSHCSHNGHNSRTCPSRSGVVVKLFGVRLTDGLISKSSSIRKSASMGNLITLHHHHHNSSTSSGSGNAKPQNGVVRTSPDHHYHHHAADGYASEDFAAAAASSSRERKKGVPWTEEEHRMFLLGLQMVGKGDWRGIARNYVISKTPTQVASHAQKYFMRQFSVPRRKRRSSLFDIVPDESMDSPMVSTDFISVNPTRAEPQSSTRLQPSSVDEECEESMEPANSNEGDTAVLQTTEGAEYPFSPFAYPAYGTGPVFPMPIVPFCWPSGYQAEHVTHQVVKPTALAHSKSPTNVSDLVGMSKLSLGDSAAGPPPVKLVQLGSTTRPSAFHANVNPSSSGSSIHVA